MSSYVRYCINAVINQFAFKPPVPARYTAQENIEFVYSQTGDKIALRCISPLERAYCRGDTYNTKYPLIIAAHGNGDDIGTFHKYACNLAKQQQANVLFFDYPGYGLSAEEMTTEKNMKHALRAVIHYALHVLKVPQSSIVLFGKSVGTAPVIAVAADSDMSDGFLGIVLVSPLASGMRAFVPAMLATQNACRVFDDMFANSMASIRKIETKILFVHGYQDRVIDSCNTHLLQECVQKKALYPPLLLAAGHNDIESSYPVLFHKTIRDFVTFCRGRFSIQQEPVSTVEEESSKSLPPRAQEAVLIDI